MVIPIESLIDSIAGRLCGLAVVKVEARLAVELAGMEQELADRAQEYRDLENELGEAIATRLENAAKKLSGNWSERHESLSSELPIGKLKRPAVIGTGVSTESTSDEKRPRGRPRKVAPAEQAESEQLLFAASMAGQVKEVQA